MSNAQRQEMLTRQVQAQAQLTLTESVNSLLNSVVSQKQSIELCKILIVASISAFTYVREILPVGCFRWHKFDVEAVPSYDTFMNDVVSESLPSSPTGIPSKFVLWPILLRGRREGADKILDMIENGIFDAYEKRHLARIQLCFFKDNVETGPAEGFSITLSYSGDETSPPQCGFFGKLGASSNISLGMALQDLKAFVCDEQTWCHNVPLLDVRDWDLNVTLMLNENCPDDYHPPKFDDSAARFFLHPDNSVKLGQLDTGRHSVSASLFTEETIAVDPRTLSGKITNLGSDHGYTRMNRMRQAQSRIARRSHTVDPRPPTLFRLLQPPIEMNSLESTQKSSDGTALIALARYALDRSESDSASQTQAFPSQPVGLSQDPKIQLNDSVESVEIEAESIPSLPYSSCLRITPPQTSKSLARPKINCQAQSTSPNQWITDLHQGAKFCLNDDEFVEPVAYSEDVIERLNRQRATSSQHKDEIVCECGTTATHFRTARCHSCGARQHAPCYGFSDEVQLPDLHACYSCLFKEKKRDGQRQTVLKVKQRCLSRFMLANLICIGQFPGTLQELSRGLGLKYTRSREACDTLRKEGFLVAAAGSRKRGFSNTGKSPYSFCSTPDLIVRIRRELFTPTLDLDDFLESPGMHAAAQNLIELSFAASQGTVSPETECARPLPAVPLINGMLSAESTTQGTPSPYSVVYGNLQSQASPEPYEVNPARFSIQPEAERHTGGIQSTPRTTTKKGHPKRGRQQTPFAENNYSLLGSSTQGTPSPHISHPSAGNTPMRFLTPRTREMSFLSDLDAMPRTYKPVEGMDDRPVKRSKYDNEIRGDD